MLKKLFNRYSACARKKRGDIFIYYCQPKKEDMILDLGGGDGSHIANILPGYTNIWVADYCAEDLAKAKEKYGFNTIKLDATQRLNIEDKQFDIVFCSSVIEHVTGDKSKITTIKDTAEFKEKAWKVQQDFAREIQRIGKKYFVQTPHRYFLVESHSWLPFLIVLLPRRWQIKLIRFCNTFWVKKTQPDWNLLTVPDMKTLFPNANIVPEKQFRMIKSIMAIGREQSS